MKNWSYEVKCEELLSIHEGDFSLWKEEKFGTTFYRIGIEGYLGFCKLENAINLYTEFLQEFKKYLLENNYNKFEKHEWNTVYKTRGMRIYYEHDYYWVFLESFESPDIWDTYNYLKDIIEQLKYFNENNLTKNGD